jgi:hypothetical protein
VIFMIEDGKYREVEGLKDDMSRRQWMWGWGVGGRGEELDFEDVCYD